MWWGHGGYFPFGFIFFVLFIAILFGCRFFAFGPAGRGCYGSGRWDRRSDAEAILMRRLANGEINEEEYTRLKEFLNKQ
jgi:uncharacterized membrane protein